MPRPFGGPWVRVVVLSVAGMALAEALGDQALNWTAEEFRLRVSEELCRARVRSTDDPLGIRDKDGVWRHFEQVLQRKLSKFGPVRGGTGRCFPFRESNGSMFFSCNAN